MAEPDGKPRNIRGVLTHHYGPLPGYGWIAAAAVGGLVYFRARRNGSGAEDTGTDPAAADQAAEEADYADDYGPYDATPPYSSGGGYSSGSVGDGGGTGAPGTGGGTQGGVNGGDMEPPGADDGGELPDAPTKLGGNGLPPRTATFAGPTGSTAAHKSPLRGQPGAKLVRRTERRIVAGKDLNERQQAAQRKIQRDVKLKKAGLATKKQLAVVKEAHQAKKKAKAAQR